MEEVENMEDGKRWGSEGGEEVEEVERREK